MTWLLLAIRKNKYVYLSESPLHHHGGGKVKKIEICYPRLQETVLLRQIPEYEIKHLSYERTTMYEKQLDFSAFFWPVIL